MKKLRWMMVTIVLSGALVAGAQPVETQYPRIKVISFNPVLKTQNNVRLHQYFNWHNPASEINDEIEGMRIGSHGVMHMRLSQYLEVDFFPIKADGFQYPEPQYLAGQWHQPDGVDYHAIVRDYNLHRKTDRGELREVGIYGAPYFGYYESRMAGFGGYWCNSPALDRIASARIFIMMGWNYERIVSLHATGHRAESIMTRTYNGWNVNANRHLWDRFGWNVGQSPIAGGAFGVGSAHYPPNGLADYDYANAVPAFSQAPSWMNDFPNFNGTGGQTIAINSQTWGPGPTNNYELSFFKWWYQHMPHVAGRNNHDGFNRLNNWWEYTFNFNAHTESGGDHAVVANPTPPPPLRTTPQRTLTLDIQDDWAPQANAHGRIVWYGAVGRQLEIFSADATGENFTRLTSNAFDDEAPRINDHNQVVWMGFNGRTFQIFTANADGSDLRQITNNDYNNFHPDINNQGRIVWYAWVGDNYEIFSANVDGSDLVRITYREHLGGARPDDVWPRINNQGRIVWMGYINGFWQIFSANSDGSGLVQLTANSSKNEYPQINDAGRVVWHTWSNQTNTQIWSTNATGGTPVLLSTAAGYNWWPQINNASPAEVVWMRRANSAAGQDDWEIWYSLATGGGATALTANNTHDQHPQIDDDGRIVWQGFDGQYWQIYERRNGQISRLTDTTYDNWWPSLGGTDLVVWHAESAPSNLGTARTTEIWAAGTDVLDQNPPTLVSVVATEEDVVRVNFSEAVDPSTAEDLANYAIEGLLISAAVVAENGSTVRLSTSPMILYATYTLAVDGVTDLSGNPIAPGTVANFVYAPIPRVSAGLQALYDFNEGAGNVIFDVSENANPLNLTIETPAAVQWTDGGLQVVQPAAIRSAGAASELATTLRTSGELTLEAWISPANTIQFGPAAIVTMSSNSSSFRNFTLGQGNTIAGTGALYAVRLRTSTTGSSGAVQATDPLVQTRLTHVAYTRGTDGATQLYVDGSPQLPAESVLGGTLDTWVTSYRLALGRDLNNTNTWLGEYRLVAIYDRALAPEEIVQNYNAGPEPFVAPPTNTCPGDMNCDTLVNFADISLFIAAIKADSSANWTYDPAGGVCAYLNGDLNGDDLVNFADISGFIAAIKANPEPCVTVP